MRRAIVLTLLLIAVVGAGAAGWVLKGREISLLVDRYGTVAGSAEALRTVRYEGNGTGGTFYLNDTSLGLNSVVPPLQPPSVGSTKEEKLGLASAGKVFPLGQLSRQTDETTDVLAAAPDPGDTARLSMEHSRLSWPNFGTNFMTGYTPSRKRHSYYRLTWSKSNGTKLEMLWRFEQYYDRANGWTNPMMMREGQTGLLKIEITP